MAIAMQLVPLRSELVRRFTGCRSVAARARFGVQRGRLAVVVAVPTATAIVLLEFCALALLLVGLMRAIRHVASHGS